MALRGVKPKTTEKRLKVMLFGVAGVGKTTAAIQFPRPYLFDTEKGSTNDQYIAAINEREGAVFHTADFEELLAEVQSLTTEKHEYRTLIIDPITVVYADLLEVSAKKVGTEFGRHYGEADKRMRHLIRLLLKVDMNVIVTAHAKTVYGDGMVKLADTFDGYKKLDYLFDLVFEVQRRGNERVGVVRKTRVAAFPERDVFPFSYDEIADRYGRAVIERDAQPTEWATVDQVATMRAFLAQHKDGSGLEDRVLTKYDVESLEELPRSVAASIVEKWGTITTQA